MAFSFPWLAGCLLLAVAGWMAGARVWQGGAGQKNPADDDPTWQRLEKRIADPAGVDVTPEVVGKFMARYAGRDIRGAWSYAQTLPEKHRKPAVVTVIRLWEGVGAPEAVEQLPEGAVKEAARQALKSVLNPDPVG